MQSLQVISLRVFVLLCFLLAPVSSWAAVVINEIAWMGTENSANDEWVELFNSGSESVDLTGWTLTAADSTPNIELTLTISAGGFLLLERTDDTSVPNVPADVIYTGALSNSGEILVFKNANSTEVDRVDGSNDWTIGGDNTTKQTPQRQPDSVWITATATPRAANSLPPLEPTPPVPPEPEPQPTVDQPQAGEPSPEPEPAPSPDLEVICESGQININTASAEKLEELVGIGPVLAGRIIEARPFSSLDDLMRVKGIGPVTVEDIKVQGLACTKGGTAAAMETAPPPEPAPQAPSPPPPAIQPESAPAETFLPPTVSEPAPEETNTTFVSTILTPKEEIILPETEDNNVAAASVAESAQSNKKQISVVAGILIVTIFSAVVGIATTMYVRKRKQKNFIS